MTVNRKSNLLGGTDHSTHHLLTIQEVPENVNALRRELAHEAHTELSAKAQEGKSFSECLAIIATQLDIAVDGLYDANDLCGLLTTSLRAKRFGYDNSSIHKLAGLTAVELEERGDEIVLKEEGAPVEETPEIVKTTTH